MRQITMLQDRAYEYMKERIIKGELGTGQIYSLNQIARDLGISKTPLRDAVMMLANEHFIDIIPSRGFMVHQLTEEDVRETYQFRHAVEIFSLRQLAEHIGTEKGQEYYHKLESLVRLQADLIRSNGDPASIRRKDYELHRTMVEFIDNTIILRMYRNHMYQISHLNVMALSTMGRRERTINEHQQILSAVLKQDYEELEHIVASHLNVAMEINLKALQSK